MRTYIMACACPNFFRVGESSSSESHSREVVRCGEKFGSSYHRERVVGVIGEYTVQ